MNGSDHEAVDYFSETPAVLRSANRPATARSAASTTAWPTDCPYATVGSLRTEVCGNGTATEKHGATENRAGLR